ncbi:hypothetical protein P7C71_g3479, partial [Lecanoromycetidae sp. Uapishka_2]
MATVAFPSPSAILRSPVQPPSSETLVKPAAHKKQPATTRAHKAAKKEFTDNSKPKQTKSRDGSPSSPITNGFASNPPDYDISLQPTLPLGPELAQQLSPLDHPQFDYDSAQYAMGGYGKQALPMYSGLPSATPSLINDSYDEDFTPTSARTAATSMWSGSPRMTDLVPSKSELRARPSDCTFPPAQSYDPHPPHSLPTFQTWSSTEEDEEDVEEIMREPDPTSSWMMPMSSPTFTDSSSSSGGSWFDALSTTVYGQPKLHSSSEEMLMLRFDRQTCGILSIKDGPTENPWRTVLWPLAKLEPALHHAINALTSFHASKEKPTLRLKGMEHMHDSIQLLNHNLTTMRPDIALSTCLVLAFCESWDILISTGITHLRGARQLVMQMLENYKMGTMLPANERSIGFLARTWVYMDVIARLTSLECDGSEDFDIALDPLCQGSASYQHVDPLMGCADSMFPIIGRVANLVCKVRNIDQDNSLQIISKANVLKMQLEKWKAPARFEEPEDKTTDVEQALRTAEAYRWATLLYLHQAVPEISYDSVTDKIAMMAKEVLTNLANVPPGSGAVIIHIFPLLAASCEAADPDSRAFVEERWQSMMQRMNIQNLDKCWVVVKEVWERRDDAEKEKLRRRARQAVKKLRTGYMPTTVQKRRISFVDEGVHDANTGDMEKRRAVEEPGSMTPKPISLKREASSVVGGLEYDLTVRGRAHWAGVMKDWSWEVLLG